MQYLQLDVRSDGGLHYTDEDDARRWLAFVAHVRPTAIEASQQRGRERLPHGD